MAIPRIFRRNFDTLRRAARDGHLALLECTCEVTGDGAMSSVRWGTMRKGASLRPSATSMTVTPSRPMSHQLRE